MSSASRVGGDARQRVMAVHQRPPVTRRVLGDRQHARRQQASATRRPSAATAAGSAPKARSPMTSLAPGTRRSSTGAQASVMPDAAQSSPISAPVSQAARRPAAVGVVQRADGGGGRVRAPVRRPQPGDAAALLIDRDHRARRQHGARARRSAPGAAPGRDVAAEQDHPGRRHRAQQRRLVRQQRRPGDADDRGPQRFRSWRASTSAPLARTLRAERRSPRRCRRSRRCAGARSAGRPARPAAPPAGGRRAGPACAWPGAATRSARPARCPRAASCTIVPPLAPARGRVAAGAAAPAAGDGGRAAGAAGRRGGGAGAGAGGGGRRAAGRARARRGGCICARSACGAGASGAGAMASAAAGGAAHDLLVGADHLHAAGVVRLDAHRAACRPRSPGRRPGGGPSAPRSPCRRPAAAPSAARDQQQALRAPGPARRGGRGRSG